MRTIDELLAEHPFFAGLDDDALDADRRAARPNVHFRPGEYLFREGEAADTFFVVRTRPGRARDARAGRRGRSLDTVEDGEVLGWSWLVPPYRWFLDARAVEEASASIVVRRRLPARQVRRGPRLGYALLQRVAQVMYHRLQSARVRLLDLYGAPSDHAR